MRSKRFFENAVFIIACCCFTAAQSGGNYTIKDATLDGAGHQTSGGNFVLEVRLGQGLAGPPLAGGNFSVGGGFFPAPPFPAVEPPAAPASLAVTAVMRDRVDLAWEDRSQNEVGFILERCNGNGRCTKWSVLSATGPDTTTFSDATVQIGSVYQYRVYAFNAAGNSPISNAVTAKTPKR